MSYSAEPEASNKLFKIRSPPRLSSIMNKEQLRTRHGSAPSTTVPRSPGGRTHITAKRLKTPIKNYMPPRSLDKDACSPFSILRSPNRERLLRILGMESSIKFKHANFEKVPPSPKVFESPNTDLQYDSFLFPKSSGNGFDYETRKLPAKEPVPTVLKFDDSMPSESLGACAKVERANNYPAEKLFNIPSPPYIASIMNKEKFRHASAPSYSLPGSPRRIKESPITAKRLRIPVPTALKFDDFMPGAGSRESLGIVFTSPRTYGYFGKRIALLSQSEFLSYPKMASAFRIEALNEAIQKINDIIARKTDYGDLKDLVISMEEIQKAGITGHEGNNMVLILTIIGRLKQNNLGVSPDLAIYTPLVA